MTSATRTQKREGDKPAIAVTEWNRPLAASAKAAFVALPLDSPFQLTMAWKAQDSEKYSRTADSDALKWYNGKVLKMQKKSAVALQAGAAVLAVAGAALF